MASCSPWHAYRNVAFDTPANEFLQLATIPLCLRKLKKHVPDLPAKKLHLTNSCALVTPCQLIDFYSVLSRKITQLKDF